MPILPTNLWLLIRNQPTIVVFHYAMGIHAITTNWNTKLREEWVLKIRGHEGSDFKLFQELCLTRSKVETFKILRLFGFKKKTLVSGVKTLQRWRLPSTQHIWSTTAQRGSCSFQVWLVIQLQSTKKDNSTCREVLMIYCEYSSNAIIVKLIYN